MIITELFVRRLGRLKDVSDHEMAALGALRCQPRSFRPGEAIIRQGQRLDSLRILTKGMTARCHYPPGRDSGRVITALHVPGDLIDIEGLIKPQLDHDIIALGPCEVDLVDYHALHRLTDGYAGLWRVFWGLSHADATKSSTNLMKSLLDSVLV